ncbi:hypothetical protein Pmani_006940 [Petrolisthes manimaculis]|uniref:Uncharacterized protein n=1 Tax=Petrolisthes manimaculis TaxID=1843537 RepID=A0AAE1QBJ7_9EUCA|nr:hypothetical protein Pmani_006940 [Petrolisthes manimaculis]
MVVVVVSGVGSGDKVLERMASNSNQCGRGLVSGGWGKMTNAYFTLSGDKYFEECSTDIEEILHLQGNLVVSVSVHARQVPSEYQRTSCPASQLEEISMEKRFSKTPMEDHAYIPFKHASAVFRRTIHSAKRASWSSYLSSITQDTPIPQFWSHIKKIAGKHSLPMARFYTPMPGHYETLIKAEILGRHFSRVSEGSNLPPVFQSLKWHSE